MKDKVMNRIIDILLILLALGFAAGCTVHRPFQSDKGKADYHLVQAVKHYPEYGDSIEITVLDTVIVPSDTILDTLFLATHDTVEIENESIRVKITRSVDTFYVEGESKIKTIYTSKVIKMPERIYITKGIDWYWIVLITLVAREFVYYLFSAFHKVIIKRFHNGK